MVLAQSAASGLAHLHLEVKGQTLEKPSIVHRNVSSKSFYVKNDGEGEGEGREGGEGGRGGGEGGREGRGGGREGGREGRGGGREGRGEGGREGGEGGGREGGEGGRGGREGGRKEGRGREGGSLYQFLISIGTCCLGDLSLAVKDDGNFLDEVKGKPLGHTLYLSPEVLDGGVVREPLSCDSWKKADVYGLGLVMWEIARRCLIQGEGGREAGWVGGREGGWVGGREGGWVGELSE